MILETIDPNLQDMLQIYNDRPAALEQLAQRAVNRESHDWGPGPCVEF